ncbi:dihydrofolate reductase [Anoplophora glabripennis]|uniref:dihydrofolate reductase n=1 Tax=Anoplophora glabripennis TaxID=217634 RepID=UPI000874789D|nr:dihydrofolate reductase [Anoplophora glabripennis]XP_018562892.1 dihydrofolate reductase [Anoplophora glabripennis]
MKNKAMVIKLNLIAAACENMGIGKGNNLPWRLRTELDYFTRMTSATVDKNKKNIVIMGRRTWDSLPNKFKPLSDRINCVLSRSDLDLKKYQDVHTFKSLEQCLEKIGNSEFRDRFETVWIIGGTNVYKESMESEQFYRLYLTKIFKHFDCDTFFPKIPDNLIEVRDPAVPEGTQKEKDVEFVYHVYENPNFKAL